MTKKDYDAIADIIHGTTFVRSPARVCKKQLVSELAEWFKYENPRFDKKKFAEACWHE